MANKNYHNKISFETDVFNMHHMLVDKQPVLEKMNILFGNKGILPDTYYEQKEWGCIKHTEPLLIGPLASSRVLERNENTIIENREYLELFLKAIRQYNSSIRIVFTLLPMFITMERASRPVLDLWKKEFEEIVNDLCIRYDAKLLDYKNQEIISSNNNFYFDTVHLNRIGGKCFTSILNEDLKNI